MNEEYPENCIRGIKNEDSLLPDGHVAAHAFDFDNTARSDGWREQSVNWKDDESAMEFTFAQTKEDGELKFKAGVAIIPRVELDRLRLLAHFLGKLDYEKCPLDGNDYHGNILLSGDVERKTARLVSAGLALHSEFVPRPE